MEKVTKKAIQKFRDDVGMGGGGAKKSSGGSKK